VTRRALPTAAAAGALALLHCSPEAPTARCAVLITIDTMRPDRTSLYGYERETTPNLARYLGEGRFRDARSSAPCTLPAVKQMLTGRLDALGPTLAEVTRDAGVRTAAFVSQHWFSGDELYRRGFDEWNVQADDELDRHGMSDRRATRVTDLALEWIRSRSRRDRFFLWVHYFDPHDPYDPPADSRRFAEGVTRYPHGDRRSAQIAAQTDEEHWFQVDHIFDEEDRDALRRLYDDEIRYTDREIGRLLDELEARRLLDGTIVLMSADHGERLGEDGIWDHCYSLHDLELRVPLVVRTADGSVPPDLDSPASTLDIFPTLVEALGVASPDGLDGRSLLEPRAGAVAVSNFEEEIAVADADWKLYLEARNGTLEPTALVRLRGDVEGDEVPLAESGEVVDRLRAAAELMAADLARARDLTEDEFRRLRSLGYTD